MAWFRARKNKQGRRDESGVALFMVLASIAVLAYLVTEYVYTAQINQRMAYTGADRVKAYYLAKSALKLQLLRLKAYQKVKALLSSNKNLSGVVPRAILDQVWSMPIMYPIPTDLPGITASQKDAIDKFQTESSLDGSFTALMESESSKYNLNMILAPYAPKAATGATGSQGAAPPADPNAPPQPETPAGAQGQTGPSGPSFNAEAARKGLGEYIRTLISSKMESDEEFATNYRDLYVDELIQNIIAWADPSVEPPTSSLDHPIPMKRAPFYSLSELHMIPLMDDGLYDVLAPAFTATTTPGINVNKMEEPTLRALVPGITDEEVKEFFEYRDDKSNDNSFKKPDDFFAYLNNFVGTFGNDPGRMTTYKQELTQRNIRIVTEEGSFKITIRAQVNQTTRIIEAWVNLLDTPSGKSGASRSATPFPQAPAPPTGAPPIVGPGVNASRESSESNPTGLQITFMRIL